MTNANATQHAQGPAVQAGESIGHGVSQIYFQANIWTGLLILAAFVVADWRMAILALLGAIAATVTAVLFKVPRSDIVAGMHGFCGTLVGAAAFAAMGGDQWLPYLMAIVGGIVCTPITLGVLWLFTHGPLKPINLPYTTAPFCITAGIVYGLTIPAHVTSAPLTAPESGGIGFLQSLLTNVSQVVLVDSAIGGALILIGLFIASWKVGVAAILGSLIGSLIALAVGDDMAKISNGLGGYSAVLTAIAMAAVFLKGVWEPWVMAVIGAVLTALVQFWMGFLPGPIYTWPYILTTWVLLILTFVIPRLVRREHGGHGAEAMATAT
ncbi:urea transporter [Leifsonia sp. A12D58]|uniref:urea transporter n=1 Tax=Leifsonia sp. A12D58 TaxID=3397674 RepID=UPI0039DFDFEF